MKFITRLNISRKFFWALYIPAFVISLFACIFLLSSRFNDLNKGLHDRTVYLSTQIATNSEFAISSSDKKTIYQILENALQHQDINGIQILNSEKNIIAELGKNSTLANKKLLESSNTEENYIEENDRYIASIQGVYNTSKRLLSAQQKIGWVRVETSKSVVQIKKYQYTSIILFVFFTFNLLAILSALYVSKKLSAPISTLSASLNKLVKGQFSTVKLMQLPEEYTNQQKDLLELAERLENHHEELIIGIEQSTEDIRRNMDSMEEKSAQLHIANREAMKSNKLKSQFIANISHEIRTPLNAILGYTKTLQKDIQDTQQSLYVDTIQQSTNSLLATIGDILDFSKIEAGKISLENHHFNLRSLIEEVYQTLSINLLTKEKQIELIPELDEEVPEWFIGDSTRIRQILTNLIGNAIKFTHQGSIRTKVTLVSNKAKEIILSIQIIDTGIGIPEHKMNRLFKPFSQVDTSTTRKFGGTGLGLVISKKLVEQMNGKIEVSSDPSVGSTFRFTLSLKESPKAKNDHSPLNRNIILLEPSSTYRRYMNQYLKSIGVHCLFCSDLEHIVRLIIQKKTAVDAIILNIPSDERSIEDAKELIIYALQQFNIACILMIQPSEKIDDYETLKNLCGDILLKPINQDRLYNAIKNINTPTLKTPPLETNKSALTGVKILAIDDTPLNLQLLSHWLKPNGVELSLAYSGQQAIEMATMEQFDLIFMDIQMPEMDGMETTRKLRSLTNYKHTPIIALTAHALGSEQQQILASGMNAYLAKPIDEETLLNTIHTWHSNNDSLQDQIDTKLLGVFDLDKALNIVDGKADIAKEMFDMLADSLDSEKKLILYHLEHKETEQLIEVVHRIHGASKYTGTISIARHAGFFETHLKELGLEDIEGVAEDFIETIDDLLNHRQLIAWPTL